MDLIQVFLLGLLQGITEFLPISSSGHFVVASKLFGLNVGDQIFLTVLLHLGSLFAVLIFFRSEIKALLIATGKIIICLAHPSKLRSLFQESIATRFLVYLIVATLVTGFFGYFFSAYFKSFFSNVKGVAINWIITGLLLCLAQQRLKVSSNPCQLNFKKAIMIGFFQSLALLPGVSRSGATLSAGLLCSLGKEESFRFAFLLVIPAILMVFFSESLNHAELFFEPENWVFYAIGFTSSLFSSFLALHLLRWLLKRSQLYPFAIYCFVIAAVTLLFL